MLTKLARFLLKQFVHPREFFGQCIKKTTIVTKRKTYKLDALPFKDFYLRIKIASIRKKLTPNVSLDRELAIDRKKHSDLIHVKSMVRILEEIAEGEQESLMKEEEERRRLSRLEEGKKLEESTLSHSLGSDEPATPKTSDSQDGKPTSESRESDFGEKPSRNGQMSKSLGEDENKGRMSKARKQEKSLSSPGDCKPALEAPELLRFGNARHDPPASANRAYKSGCGPNMVLGTIEEDKAETQTSNYQDGLSEREDSRLFSSN